jgi:hypothetical protein
MKDYSLFWKKEITDICKTLSEEGYKSYFYGSTARNLRLKIRNNSIIFLQQQIS